MRIGHALWADLCAHVLSDPVHEVCGVLLGQWEPLWLQDVVPGLNVATERRNCFVLDAQTLLTADAQARASGQYILGFYHSHPVSAPVPSAADRSLLWLDTIQLIVGVGRTMPVMCAWQSRGTLLLPCSLEFES